MSPSYDAIIIGAGITGLAAAHRLATIRPTWRTLMIEGTPRLGGKIATERVDGFVIEGGPDCFLAVKPAGIALCRELGIEATLQGTDPANRRSYIKRRGRLNELPAGLTGLVPSRLGPLLRTRTLSWSGRLRAGMELLVPRRRHPSDETIREFVVRRFGAEAYDWLVEPLMAGIHAGDGARLSLAATFPQLVEMERTRGSVLRSMLGRPPAPRAEQPTFVTTTSGLGTIVETIADRLGHERVLTARPVRSIERFGRGFRVALDDGQTLETATAIVATPAAATAAILRAMAPALAAELAAIPFVSTAIVTMGFRREDVRHPLGGSGYIVPRAAGGPIVACSWTSSKFQHRAPRDRVLVRLFVGRAGADHLVSQPDAELVDLARAEVRDTLAVDAAPILTRVTRWLDGLPQYNQGHLERLSNIDRLVARVPGLILAGASYRGVGIPDCIQSGWHAAEVAASSEHTRP